MNISKQVNHYLGVNYFNSPISEQTIKEELGISLTELKHLWIFSSKNYFKEAVKDFTEKDIKINFKTANKVKV